MKTTIKLLILAFLSVCINSCSVMGESMLGALNSMNGIYSSAYQAAAAKNGNTQVNQTSPLSFSNQVLNAENSVNGYKFTGYEPAGFQVPTQNSTSSSKAPQAYQETCPKCQGAKKIQSGGIGNNNFYRCDFCGGKGTVTRYH